MSNLSSSAVCMQVLGVVSDSHIKNRATSYCGAAAEAVCVEEGRSVKFYTTVQTFVERCLSKNN